VYPSLHLTPLNDTFVPKQISLNPPGTRVKIGRQTNAKTVPNDRNGYFDSKVLSRMHAEVWCEDGKVFIKDVKSSNGTFINGDRLSPESVESEPWELHTDDVVEFGIDIVSEDNKTIVHHKVSAKVFLVLNAEDAIASSRQGHLSAWFRSVGESPLHRRGKPGGAGVLGFDHVLSRLQNEIQKSKETNSELNGITSTMGSIHETMNGGVSNPPPISANQIPPFPPRVPPMLPGTKDYGSTITSLQNQLSDTQASLASHTERMRNLESLLAEHESLKREVSEMRGVMEESKREVEEAEDASGGRVSPVPMMLEQEDEDDENGSAKNMDTVRLKEAPPVHAMPNGILVDPNTEKIDALAEQLQAQNAALTERIEKLSLQLQEAAKLSDALKAQHDHASTTIRLLEEKISGLENEGQKWQGWRSKFEAEWQQDRKAWEEEREKLKQFVSDWEVKQAAIEKQRLLDEQSDDESDSDEGTPRNGENEAEGGEEGKSSRPKRRRRRRSSPSR
ncbi:hypothetical protein BT69DRAFT_1207803, partial [Atractiella rhizophila]